MEDNKQSLNNLVLMASMFEFLFTSISLINADTSDEVISLHAVIVFEGLVFFLLSKYSLLSVFILFANVGPMLVKNSLMNSAVCSGGISSLFSFF